jgi:hypothetical protein
MLIFNYRYYKNNFALFLKLFLIHSQLSDSSTAVLIQVG